MESFANELRIFFVWWGENLEERFAGYRKTTTTDCPVFRQFDGNAVSVSMAVFLSARRHFMRCHVSNKIENLRVCNRKQYDVVVPGQQSIRHLELELIEFHSIPFQLQQSTIFLMFSSFPVFPFF